MIHRRPAWIPGAWAVLASTAAWAQAPAAAQISRVPGKDHEFWIRRGAENMEKVFLVFSTVSKRTHGQQ